MGFWYKKFNGYGDLLAKQFNTMLHECELLPNWLSTAYIVLLPKNTDTHIPKNYYLIAYLNILRKFCISCINSF